MKIADLRHKKFPVQPASTGWIPAQRLENSTCPVLSVRPERSHQMVQPDHVTDMTRRST